MRALSAVLLSAFALAACGGGAPVDTRGGGDETATWELSPGWSRLPSPAQLPQPPIAWGNAAHVWTGGELIAWGGHSEFSASAAAHGAAYDATARRWRMLPHGPLAGRDEAAVAWTGEELVIWGGMDGEARPRDDGAALDPATGSWRRLPPSPLDPRRPAIAVWTGEEFVGWGDANRFSAARDGAAYDPAADRWRRLAPAPLALNRASAVWTGAEVVIYGALLDGANVSASRHAHGIAYDPTGDRWRRLPPYPLSPQASSVAWTGAEMVAWDYELRAATYDPARNGWEPLPDLPLDFGECSPVSAAIATTVFASYCGRAALLDLTTRAWREIRLPRPWLSGTPVAAGAAVLFLGAAEGGVANSLWAYRPE